MIDNKLKEIYMESHPKIGIMTYYAAHNYGAALQAFALQQNVKKLGGAPEFLRFFDRHNLSIPAPQKKKTLLRRICNPRLLLTLLNLKNVLSTRRFNITRGKAFEDFKNKYLQESTLPYYDLEDLRESNTRYSGFITGSDMVWTPIGQSIPAYFLQFASKEKRFAYSPSMTGCSTYTEEDVNEIKDYLHGIRMISCREKEGVDFVKSQTGIDAEHTLDPTILFNKEDWMRELMIIKNKPKVPYILCYNFKGLPSHIQKEVNRIASENNMDIRYIPMNDHESLSEIKKGIMSAPGPREFVELFLNASFVISNGFHGFLFSLISEKPFVVVRRENGNAWKSNESRISDFMKILGLEDRYIEPDDNIQNNMLKLDYTSINPIIEGERLKSLSYLKSIVEACANNKEGESKIYTNVKDLPVNECTGCSLCSQICPFGAIVMKTDEEGFIYPAVNLAKCRECGKCAKHCPSVHPLSKNTPKETKVALSKDVLINGSASGGFFITIARYFIEVLHGVIYGVVLDGEMTCKHVEALTMEEVVPMQNSKYIQSAIGDTYVKIKKRLEEGKYVLFSGTPCQVAALKSYLGEDNERLLTIDVVCHGVPNQVFWKKYINEELRDKDITGFNFRTRGNRKNGKTTLEATAIFKGFSKQIPWEKSAYYGPYILNESFRKSCYYCQYAQPRRVSDITMGDCDSEKKYMDFYPTESKSIVLLNTEKSISFWRKIEDRFAFTELDYQAEVFANNCLRYPSIRPLVRQFIYKDMQALSWNDFCEKYIQHDSKSKQLMEIVRKIVQ